MHGLLPLASQSIVGLHCGHYCLWSLCSLWLVALGCRASQDIQQARTWDAAVRLIQAATVSLNIIVLTALVNSSVQRGSLAAVSVSLCRIFLATWRAAAS